MSEDPIFQNARARAAYRHYHRWTTFNEIQFIDALGTGKFRSTFDATRQTLLERYFASIPLRIDWGEVDRRTIEAYLVKLLQRRPE